MAEPAQSIREDERTYAELADRGFLRIAGNDRRAFLQGLVSNDINKVGPDTVIYAALLSAQGKYLHDFFIVEIGDAFFLDAEAARLSDLKRRLLLYKLRADVEIVDASEHFVVVALFGDGALSACKLPLQPGAAKQIGNGVLFVDPRLAALGARLLAPRGGALPITALSKSDSAAYDRLRLSLGVPDGSRDLTVDKAILLEAGFDELNGIDWQKGCYVGQELTARTKYRGLIKKRLVPVEIEGPVPVPGAPIMLGARDAGEMRSARDGIGIALLRLEALDELGSTGELLTSGETRLRPRKPDWARF